METALILALPVGGVLEPDLAKFSPALTDEASEDISLRGGGGGGTLTTDGGCITVPGIGGKGT